MSAEAPYEAPLLERLPTPPEEINSFRLGRLLLLMDEVRRAEKAKPLDIERLGFYDFFAANPFLIVPSDVRARTRLVLAGFDSRTLGYQSSFHRFTTRRQRMRFDLSQLVGYDLVEARAPEGKIVFAATESGATLSESLTTLYALAYRESAQLIIAILSKLSDRRLHEQAGEWLQAKAFLIDLFDTDRSRE